jgi:hypothetical protein
MPLQERLDDERREVVRADGRERSAVLAHGGANGIDDDWLSHG